MKPNSLLTLLLLFGGLNLATSVLAHPENSPLTFSAHKSVDGRIIYSNIPGRCFKNGVLTCYELHPVFDTSVYSSKSVPKASTASSNRTNKSSQQNNQKTTGTSGSIKKSAYGKCHASSGVHYNRTAAVASYSSMKECESSGGVASKN
jgi:hypothetical protein